MIVGLAHPLNGQTDNDKIYRELLDAAKTSATEVDYTAIRKAFADSPSYCPYEDCSETVRSMKNALKRNDYAAVVELGEKHLEKNYLEIEVHLLLARGQHGLGDAERADYHRSVVSGLIQSILDSGDGLTEETAFEVISVTEEYTVLRALRIKDQQQMLTERNGQYFDVIDGTRGEDSESVRIYFNATKPVNWLHSELKKKSSQGEQPDK